MFFLFYSACIIICLNQPAKPIFVICIYPSFCVWSWVVHTDSEQYDLAMMEPADAEPSSAKLCRAIGSKDECLSQPNQFIHALTQSHQAMADPIGYGR